MSDANADQIAQWNGPMGQKWVHHRDITEHVVLVFGQAAMHAAAPVRGDRAVDIGCGCGDTSIALARRVGPTGSVLGVDVSAPMLAVARADAEKASLPQLTFLEADASALDLPEPADLLYSRFGVMFFADPVHAFTHLAGLLRPGGRVAFCCWRHPRENPWAMVPLLAARQALAIVEPPADLSAPGPFAFHDPARVTSILSTAGLTDIGVAPVDASLFLGETPQSAAQNTSVVGPASRLLRTAEAERGLDLTPVVVDAIARALEPFAGEDGVRLAGAAWVMSARRPA